MNFWPHHMILNCRLLCIFFQKLKNQTDFYVLQPLSSQFQFQSIHLVVFVSLFQTLVDWNIMSNQFQSFSSNYPKCLTVPVFKTLIITIHYLNILCYINAIYYMSRLRFVTGSVFVYFRVRRKVAKTHFLLQHDFLRMLFSWTSQLTSCSLFERQQTRAYTNY